MLLVVDLAVIHHKSVSLDCHFPLLNVVLLPGLCCVGVVVVVEVESHSSEFTSSSSHSAVVLEISFEH